MNKVLKKIPEFKTEDEEIEFWSTHETSDYIDWSKAKLATFPNLKPSTETISLRLPRKLLIDLKTAASRRDVPYQSLIKMLLYSKLQEEFGK